MRSSRASVRLQVAAAALGLDALWSGVHLRVSNASQTAVWVYNKTRATAEIHCNPFLCERLPSVQLQALLLHELYHHVGYSGLTRLRGLPCRSAVNLAFDVALERQIHAGAWGPALAALNDALLFAELPPVGPLPLEASRTLIVHSRPPLERMLPEHRAAWTRIWDTQILPSPEECYQILLPLFECEGFATPTVSTLELLDEETGWSEVLMPHCMPDDEPGMQVSDGTRQRLVEGIGDATGAGVTSWLRPLLCKPVSGTQASARTAREWLVAQRATDAVTDCVRQVAGDLVPDTVRLPYLLRPTRGELVRRVCGWPALYYSNTAPSSWRPLGTYVDVSGSMFFALPFVISVLKQLADLLTTTLHAFDTEVVAIRTTDALVGKILQGGGTSFDAVYEHALAVGFTDIVMFTDGESEVSKINQERACSARLRVRAVLFGATRKQPWWYASVHVPLAYDRIVF